VDLVLSSGFLAFARHVGVLAAFEEYGLRPEAICGTSSGALVGALWAAGHPAEVIGRVLSEQTPLSSLRVRATPWSGLFSLAPLIARLESLLPANIEALALPFAVGVMGPGRRHHLLTSGPLAHAVAASCAMPHVFAPVPIAGVPYQDGGAVDRLGLEAWRAWRSGRSATVHWVERTAGVEVGADLSGLRLIRTPRSGAKLWDLGDFWRQVDEARELARAALAVSQ
jgi:predicted acylesterase/phospholipase RssA